MSNRSIIAGLALVLLITGCESPATSVEETPRAEEPTTVAEELPAEEETMIWPGDFLITQGFSQGHYAVDFARKDESVEHPPIVAVLSGTVIEASGSGEWNGGYGNYLVIEHPNGLITRYSKCDEVFVEVGDTVTQGQEIATMGNTGRVYGETGIHMHFEVIQDETKLNPMDFLE